MHKNPPLAKPGKEVMTGETTTQKQYWVGSSLGLNILSVEYSLGLDIGLNILWGWILGWIFSGVGYWGGYYLGLDIGLDII